MKKTRREFIKQGLAVVSAGAVAPTVFVKRVLGKPDPAYLANANMERTLVVIQLNGGNDGLNTLVPYTNSIYYSLRPNVAIPANNVLPLTDNLGWNPYLVEMKAIYDSGEMAILQNVGYPQNSRSHFRATEIWNTANPNSTFEFKGWLGKYIDASLAQTNNPLVALSIGGSLPLSLRARTSVPAVGNLDDFQFRTDTRYTNDSQNNKIPLLVQIHKEDLSERLLLDYLRQSGLDTYISSTTLQEGIKKYRSTVQYPATTFARQLQMIAKVIAADLGTRVFHVSQGGYDTHINHSDPTRVIGHDLALQTLSKGIDAFYADLKQMGKADNVLIMTVSEFGRTIKENGNRGTDHGTGAPMFLIGLGVSGGLFGEAPNLSRLVGGEPVFDTDFRSMYATVLEKWLGVDAGVSIINANQFPRLDFIKA